MTTFACQTWSRNLPAGLAVAAALMSGHCLRWRKWELAGPIRDDTCGIVPIGTRALVRRLRWASGVSLPSHRKVKRPQLVPTGWGRSHLRFSPRVAGLAAGAHTLALVLPPVYDKPLPSPQLRLELWILLRRSARSNVKACSRYSVSHPAPADHVKLTGLSRSRPEPLNDPDDLLAAGNTRGSTECSPKAM